MDSVLKWEVSICNKASHKVVKFLEKINQVKGIEGDRRLGVYLKQAVREVLSEEVTSGLNLELPEAVTMQISGRSQFKAEKITLEWE